MEKKEGEAEAERPAREGKCESTGRGGKKMRKNMPCPRSIIDDERRSDYVSINVILATFNPCMYLLHSKSTTHRTTSLIKSDSVGGDSPTDCCAGIKVHLSLTQGTRTHTAIRTLSQILKLHDDLSIEIMPSKGSGKRQQTTQGEILLPPVPPLGRDFPSSNACSGGGFAQVRSQLVYYCPVLEKWFRDVIDIVGRSEGRRSPALSSFLWEPLGDSSHSATPRRGRDWNRNTDLQGKSGDRAIGRSRRLTPLSPSLNEGHDAYDRIPGPTRTAMFGPRDIRRTSASFRFRGRTSRPLVSIRE